ncbi:MAG TPA: DUF2284 domain-containing protein [Spirochaetota bacterium]|nr:DUF2284 domain-containing protein [Spirochaetota bacterium]HPC41181.1 DUF2284 domain-containing protein [Spirochaetota bacterium]HPL17122.1 DUF2284 domain-containing protein [Spirochaetota bacterium]HQF07101.1 DUF2284 domain-containing protein [Spirochaetota bacterium]HQH95838.1 DUF2284 domain-containing protein [Spirochaetota bacterium]
MPRRSGKNSATTEGGGVCPEEGCRYPEKARPSMEGCGMDVYATARGSGYPIRVVKDESSGQNYYGVVLIE